MASFTKRNSTALKLCQISNEGIFWWGVENWAARRLVASIVRDRRKGLAILSKDSSDSHACQFLDLLTSFGLQNHVTNPTHVHGHVLDLVITRVTENIVSNVSVHGQVVSDYNLHVP